MVDAPKVSDDEYPEQEAEQRLRAALRTAMSTPHKPHGAGSDRGRSTPRKRGRPPKIKPAA